MRALLEDDPPTARGPGLAAGGAPLGRTCARSAAGGPRCAARDRDAPVGGRAVRVLDRSSRSPGSAFAKQTEHLDPYEHAHPLLASPVAMIAWGAGVGAAAIALGGLPLVWQAMQPGRAPSRPAPGAAAGLARAGGLGCSRSPRMLATVAPARHGGFPAQLRARAARSLSASAACACALVGALAPKAVMRRSEPPAAMLRLAAGAGQAPGVAIVLVAAGLASTSRRCGAPGSAAAPPDRSAEHARDAGLRARRRRGRRRSGPDRGDPRSPSRPRPRLTLSRLRRCAGRGPSTAPGHCGECAPAPRRARYPSHPTATRAGTGQIAPSSVQHRTMSRTERIPTVSPPSRTIRWRKFPCTIAAAASSRDQSGAA